MKKKEKYTCGCGDYDYTVVWTTDRDFTTVEYCPFCGIVIDKDKDDFEEDED